MTTVVNKCCCSYGVDERTSGITNGELSGIQLSKYAGLHYLAVIHSNLTQSKQALCMNEHNGYKCIDLIRILLFSHFKLDMF